MLHLVVTHEAGLLHHDAAAIKGGEVGYAADVEARGEFGMFLVVDLKHHGPPGHFGGCARDLGAAARHV